MQQVIKRVLQLGLVFSLVLGTSFFSSISSLSAQNLAPSSDKKVSFDLSHYKGQFVYLDFWASWCGPCRASFPWMNDLQKEFKDKNLKIVSINLDAEREDADDFLVEFPANFDVIFDSEGKIAENYELLGMPSSFFFDTQGKLLFSHIGFNHKDAPELREKIQALMAKENNKVK